MRGRPKKTVMLATGAVLAAACVALNFVASLHIIRLDVVFYLVSGALVYFAAARFGAGAGAAFWAVSSILSFALVPDKVWILFFIGVFGPAALLQTLIEKRAGARVSCVLTIAAFILLFYLFGFIIAYGGGFVPLIGLPEAGRSLNTILALAFAAFSAVISYIVNRGLFAILSRRIGRRTFGKAGDMPKHIDLPRLWEDD